MDINETPALARRRRLSGCERERPGLVGEQVAAWSLRLGLAFVFLYAAMSSFFEPATFAGYFPAFLPSSWAAELLPAFAVFEVALALVLLTGRQTYRAAVLAAFMITAITAANPDAFEVLFRNVAIAGAALALAAQTRPGRLAGADLVVAVEAHKPALRVAEAHGEA